MSCIDSTSRLARTVLALAVVPPLVSAADTDESGYWLRLQQDQQAQELDQSQEHYKAEHKDLPAYQQWRLERGLQGQRADQGQLQLRQTQREMTLRQRVDAQSPLHPGAGATLQHQERQRIQLENNQLRLQQEIQRRSWVYPN